MSAILRRTSAGMSTYVSVEISPATTTRPVVISVSQATRPLSSSARTASSTVSEIWSAILSGCPSVTDSDVNRKSRAGIRARLLDRQKTGEDDAVAVALRVEERRLERLDVLAHVWVDLLPRQAGEGVEGLVEIDVGLPDALVGQLRGGARPLVHGVFGER